MPFKLEMRWKKKRPVHRWTYFGSRAFLKNIHNFLENPSVWPDKNRDRLPPRNTLTMPSIAKRTNIARHEAIQTIGLVYFETIAQSFIAVFWISESEPVSLIWAVNRWMTHIMFANRSTPSGCQTLANVFRQETICLVSRFAYDFAKKRSSSSPDHFHERAANSSSYLLVDKSRNCDLYKSADWRARL